MKLRHAGLSLAVIALGHALALSPLHASDQAAHAPAPRGGSPSSKLLRDASLMLLKEGNDRYVAGKSQHPNSDAARRTSTAAGQEPFASILSCADSRGPVELIFDRGLGDLFVVRVAGNIAGESELASLEYGVGHLNTPILVVLGHTKCGAVTAVAKGAELHGHLHALKDLIEPAAEKARAEAGSPDELVPRAIQANVWNMMERLLRESDVIREKVEGGAAHIVGAVYDLETGRVNWLGAHPAQDAIVALANQAKTDPALANSKKSFAPDAHAEAPAKGAAGHGAPAAASANLHGARATTTTTAAPHGTAPTTAAGATPNRTKAPGRPGPPPPPEPHDEEPPVVSKTKAKSAGGLAASGSRETSPEPAHGPDDHGSPASTPTHKEH